MKDFILPCEGEYSDSDVARTFGHLEIAELPRRVFMTKEQYARWKDLGETIGVYQGIEVKIISPD